MSWWSTVRSVGDALGIKKRRVVPVGCMLGQSVIAEAKRAAQIVNFMRRSRPLRSTTIERLKPLFADLDIENVKSG